MKSERCRQVVDAQGPFASISFDDSHDTQDAGAQLNRISTVWMGPRSSGLPDPAAA